MVTYKCYYCQQSFYHRGNYAFHNKNINRCKERFENDIQKFKKYTNEKLMFDFKNFIIFSAKNQCEYCKKNFTSSNALKYHYKNKACKEQQIINIKTANVQPNAQPNAQTNTQPNAQTNQVTTSEKYKKKTIPLSLKRVVWEVCLR